VLLDPTFAAQPLATAEFLAVDTETNGLARDACELTEVGAVLVGGGELHDRWSSLVGVSVPLSRGIQRFTGISQTMVDTAPPPEAVLPQLAARMRGRILVAHNARFDEGVLRQAFSRAGLDWPAPPVLCTVAIARRFAPLQQRRGLATLADALGIEVEATHRALPDAETCARVFCALFGRLCANATTVGEALEALKPRRRAPARGAQGRAAAAARAAARPLAPARRIPGVYVFRDADGRPLYVGKSVPARRARAATSRGHGGVDGPRGSTSTRGDRVRARRPAARAAADPRAQAARATSAARRARRLRLPALPARHPVPDPRGGARARAGHAVCVGPSAAGGGRRARRAAQLALRLRHCGRTLPRRRTPRPTGRWAAACRPASATSTRTSTASGSTRRSRLFGRGGRREALLAHIESQMRARRRPSAFERAAWLRRRTRA
jgi:DNA polymerase-3 subunit epsilon